MKNEMIDMLNFLTKIEKLKSVTRHSKTSSGRRESASEHSWCMAIIAILFHKYFPDINILKVIKMCLYHDLGEIIEGDIPVFYKNKNDEEHEYNNLMKLFEDIDLDIKYEILKINKEFNKQNSEEAKLATAIDKLEVIIQHNEADINTWIKKEYKYNLDYAVNETNYNEFLKEFRGAVKEVTLKKIKEAGKKIDDKIK